VITAKQGTASADLAIGRGDGGFLFRVAGKGDLGGPGFGVAVLGADIVDAGLDALPVKGVLNILFVGGADTDTVGVVDDLLSILLDGGIYGGL
jgi:hypothetical protein